MGPTAATDALRKALAMGATRAYHVQDAALAGSDVRATVDVLAAALRKLTFDLVFAGADTSDGLGGRGGRGAGGPARAARTSRTPRRSSPRQTGARCASAA